MDSQAPLPQPIADIGRRIVREFGVLRSWQDKYGYIVELGRKMPLLDPEKKSPERIIHGCQSNVWLDASIENDRIWLRADADSAIVKGLVALLIRFYNGQTLADAVQSEPLFIQEIGMDRHFSATRANGLRAMRAAVKTLALRGSNLG